MVGLAVAFGCGVALVQLGAPLPPAPLLLAALLVPIGACARPRKRAPGGPHETRASLPPLLAAGIALTAGVLHGLAWEGARRSDCRVGLLDGRSLEVVGRVVEGARRGRLRLDVADGGEGSCPGTISVVLPRERRVETADGASPAPIPPGAVVDVGGRWSRRPAAGGDPERAGELVAERVTVSARRAGGGLLVRRRAAVEARLARLYPRRHGLVSALILARKDGLDASLRRAFARAGTAHLLAISGFHVGVVAGLLLGLMRSAGLSRRPAGVGAAAAVWGYVLFIGAPDAAARAALILTLFAAGALRGRPLSGPGALATSFLLLLALDAGALARPGFQLSFAGAAGLVLLAGVLDRRLAKILPGDALGPIRGAAAAGAAATLFTLPVVAWHFDGVSLVGIPATLLSTPLVAAAIPGAFASLAADSVSPALGAFVAGGVDLLLQGLLALTRVLAGLPFAVASVPRAWILAGAGGAAAALALLSGARHTGRTVRASVALGGALAAVLLLPVTRRAAAAGAVELHFLDVGQGDAILVRSPRARWLLVDAGPPAPPGSAAEPAAAAALRRLGVDRIELMVLTHPHLDHIGGAGVVFDALEVAAVLDPGRPHGTGSYVDVLEAAQRERTGWRSARPGDRFDLDGVSVEVVHTPAAGSPSPEDVNENSVVLLVRFGSFEALLTGDAPARIEEAAVGRSGPVELLKVGHHGSRTSTSRALLAEARPEAAVISAGRRNRYGHPHAEVVARLLESGAELYRTDRDGTVRVVARADGSFSVRRARGGR